MTIADLEGYGKGVLARIPAHMLVALAVLLSGTAGFGLGLLEGHSAGQGGVAVTDLGTTSPASLGVMAAAAAPATAPATLPAGGEVVASKSGTKYYLPWCGTVKNIKEENKVWFVSRAAAEAAGYQPASNCKGL